MADNGSRTGESIFAHKQTYSQKGNSRSRSVAAILEGMEPCDLLTEIREQVTDRNRVLRQLRKKRPEQKKMLRGMREDTHILVAAVYSYPDTVGK